MLFVLVLVGIMSTTEGRSTNTFDFPIPLPICTSVVGVKSGDTCFDIAQKFKLSTKLFNSINPNLDCDKLFVGEWICVEGI
ncbi:putative LysM domain-containing protein [Helianthus anomalus]